MMNNGENTQGGRLFKYIREYHEVLTFIVFFGGSVVWTVGYFATKSDLKELQGVSNTQIERLHCLLRLNIEWLAGEQVWKITNDEITKIEEKIRILTPLPGVLPDATTLHRIVELEREREEKKKDIDVARLQKNESKSRLMRGECGR